jgi:exopolyphosphatase/guanosine-5'-triphosphate,3'-diphosphate pyrophosphatase
VAEVLDGGLAEVVQQRSFTRLARGLQDGGDLAPDVVAAVAEVVERQRGMAEAAGAERLRVVATAAVRCAGNRDALVAAIRTRAGLEVEILHGDEEAALAFHGATRTLGAPPLGTVAVVDVGGLSTEIAVGTVADGVTWARSYAVGSGRLADRCAADPPSADDVAMMRAAAAAALAEGGAIPATAEAIAVGGSAASLPTLVGPVIDAPALERALGVLSAASAAEIAGRHGLAPERTQLLPAGILVLGAAADRLGRPLRIGRGGLREGVVLRLAKTA